MYHVCQSVHGRGGIYTTTILSFTSFKYLESCVQNSKKICCKLCGKYAAKFVSLLALASCQQFWPRGYCEGHPGKPLCTLPTHGAGGHSRAPNVHLQAGLLPNQVARCPIGSPLTKQCNLTYAGQWAGRIANRSIG